MNQTRPIGIVALLIGAVVCLSVMLWFLLRGDNRPNVIIITLDTTRADRLACYGFAKPTTPHLDALAGDAVLFTHAVSPVPLTLPAHCSIMTGLIPPAHGVHGNVNYRLSDSNVTLAERLKAEGYSTAAVIGSVVLNSLRGLNQGFDAYDDHIAPGVQPQRDRLERRAEEVSERAIAWVSANRSSPFFMFLHYYDPHHLYDPPQPFATKFAGDPYAGEIAYVDECVGRVLTKLKQLGLYDSSLIVVAGDHGESLGEHGESKHGYFIYDSTSRVPLLIKPPNHHLAKRVDDKVALVDITPTVLGQLGLTGGFEFQGVDLSPQMAGESSTAGQKRYVYSECMTPTKYRCSSLLGLETDEWKYIDAPKPELFNLSTDPRETNNLFDNNRERAQSMQGMLRSILAEHKPQTTGESTVQMDPESLDQLRSLGYTGGSVSEDFQPDSQDEDPKDFITIFGRIEQMDEFDMRGDLVGVKRVGAEIIELRPDFVPTRQWLVKVALSEQDSDAAMEHSRACIRLEPDALDAAEWHNNLGILLGEKGQIEEAIEEFEEALRLARRDFGKTEDMGFRERTLLPDSTVARFWTHFNLGKILEQQGELAKAANHLRQASLIGPANPRPHCRLGIVLLRAGELDQAIEALKTAVRLDATNQTPARQALQDALALQAGNALP